MAMTTMPRFAHVTWHLAGGNVRYETQAIPLGEDPATDLDRIREYLARKRLRTEVAAPLVVLDEVEDYETYGTT